jgi:UDP-2,3-diacylglucosamine pyrophosphatase LpxH
VARTLVISDLHIGTRAAVSVLERPAPLEALLAELERVERLVLLGDIVELMEARPRSAMSVAAPILRAIGERLEGRGTIVLVPGNHDRPLVRGWARHRGASLELDSRVPPDASPLLQELVALLGPGSVEVRYPGVWLADGVWATHGHYLDRHLIPVSTWGLLRGRRRPVAERVSVFDYERSGRVQLSPAVRRLPRPLAVGLEDVADLVRAATMPRVQRRVLHRRFAPLTAHLLNLQMRRHSLPALARVVRHLGIDAQRIVFGHVHRLGPLAGDDPARWRSHAPAGGDPEGELRFLNTGSWVYEPLLVHSAVPPHPYWPGGAVVLEDDAEPRAVGLLDQLAATELRGAHRRLNG